MTPASTGSSTRVEDAAGEILGFYRNYHSLRWVGDTLVLRLESAPTPEEAAHLSERFADATDGPISVLEAPLPAERRSADFPDLARVALRFDRLSYARLRQLIDALNDTPERPTPAGGRHPRLMSGRSYRITEPSRSELSEAPSRVVFGPHETNLARGRALSGRHVAYYSRRAAGGRRRDHHRDGLGDSRRLAVRAGPAGGGLPSGLEVDSRCLPAPPNAGPGQSRSQRGPGVQRLLPAGDVGALPGGRRRHQRASRRARRGRHQCGGRRLRVGGSGSSRAPASTAWRSTAGAWSLLRQFQSGLTNQRADGYGEDRLRLSREVLAAVRRAVGAERIVALRLSCDELAPWAGITPEQALEAVADLASRVDLLTVVRGGPYSTSAYRPDAHTPPSFNLDLCRAVREAVGRLGDGRASGQRRRRRCRRRRGGRGCRRHGGDDQGPDRGAEAGRPSAIGVTGAHQALSAVQPGLPGARQPQSHRLMRRRAFVGPRDQRNPYEPSPGQESARVSSWWDRDPPGWSAPASWPSQAGWSPSATGRPSRAGLPSWPPWARGGNESGC